MKIYYALDPPCSAKAPWSVNIITRSTLDYISGRAGEEQGLAALRQPYKDAGLEFGGKRVTKRSAESANTRTVEMEMATCRRIAGLPGYGTGDVYLLIVCRY